MRTKETFFDVQKGRLTTLEKITFVEQATDGYDPVKLAIFQQDLDRYIASVKRESGKDVLAIFMDCLYEAAMCTCQHIPVLQSITREQFWQYLSAQGRELATNKPLMLRAIQIGKDKHGGCFEEQFTDLMDLLVFQWMIEGKMKELNSGNEGTDSPACKTAKSGRQPTYDIEDSKRWIHELRADPAYQHPTGSPNIGAIDAELTRRHRDKTGQKPSFATIKNHRRELGFMQKEGIIRVNKG